MIHIKYKIWFALKLEIEDFSGNAFDLCSLAPTDECLHALHNGRILVKQQPNLLTHLIEVAADGPDVDKPLYPPVQTAAFRYQLLDKAGGLMTKTNIASLDPTNYTLYLSNNAGNKVGSNLYTHKTGNTTGSADRVFKAMFADTQNGALAVADVFQNQLVPPDYRLLEGTGKCREPVFIIRFAKHP